jgi:acetolactate synthase-1/2/3 large subunit
MVRQWQELFFEKRYSQTHIAEGNPDFIRVAEAYGAAGIRVTDPAEVEKTLKQSMEVKDRPVVMDFIVEPESQVLPMVPAGASLNEMITGD